ncbi:integrase [Candidatus Magnetomorum sp. HK-1]|nr:integrase [Candidatus Magnetomorum sp. HK-1]
MNQFELIEKLHSKDLSSGYAGVFLPGLLENKYKNYSRELIWQWFFPAISLTFIPETKKQKRYHLHERQIGETFKAQVFIKS